MSSLVEIPEGYKLIPGHENYACSEWGDVFNLKTGKILKKQKNKKCSGYRVTLNRKNYSLSCIVCLTYNGACPYKHKSVKCHDGDRNNLHYKNLSWHNQDENRKKCLSFMASYASRYY